MDYGYWALAMSIADYVGSGYTDKDANRILDSGRMK
jgi:hypothetical protein